MIELHQGDCLEVMQDFESEIIDLTITSPPYDNLRTYNNQEPFTFEKFQKIAKQLFRVTKPGGVVVWVVGDETIKGSETGTSFRQALYFKEIGFNLHDTMIYQKKNSLPNPQSKKYRQAFEYMFILSRGEPTTFNPIMVDIFRFDQGKYRTTDGKLSRRKTTINKNKQRKINNIFSFGVGGKNNNHPAPFPEQLANDHIITWSNPGDTVQDNMMGSGTVGKMAVLNDRNFIGIELDPEYFKIAEKRINDADNQLRF